MSRVLLRYSDEVTELDRYLPKAVVRPKIQANYSYQSFPNKHVPLHYATARVSERLARFRGAHL